MKPTHKHYKGGLYEVLIPLALEEATLSPVVVYQGEDGRIWVRPWRSFHELVGVVPRFQKIN